MNLISVWRCIYHITLLIMLSLFLNVSSSSCKFSDLPFIDVNDFPFLIDKNRMHLNVVLDILIVSRPVILTLEKDFEFDFNNIICTSRVMKIVGVDTDRFHYIPREGCCIVYRGANEEVVVKIIHYHHSVSKELDEIDRS